MHGSSLPVFTAASDSRADLTDADQSCVRRETLRLGVFQGCIMR